MNQVERNVTMKAFGISISVILTLIAVIWGLTTTSQAQENANLDRRLTSVEDKLSRQQTDILTAIGTLNATIARLDERIKAHMNN